MSNQLQITGGGKVRNLEGVITGTSGVLSSVPLGAANGVATLDSGGKVPVSQLPSSVVTYLGTWNAATNTPTLVNGTGDAGDMYICNVAGTVNFGAGPVVFVVGDWVLYGSGTWQKSSGQNGTVTSVGLSTNGGAITIGSSPVTTSGVISFNFNGTNLQYVNGAGNLTTFPILTGYVTAVSGTAPVVSSGGTTPAISMAAATGSVDGYLSATDFAIFNAKQSALTFSSPLVNTSGTISIPAATTSVNGYLASADFTTFNNKQNAITLTTTGSSGVSTLVGATLNIPNYGSALTGYVPYTGATQDVDLGAFSLNGKSLHIKGTAGNGHLGLKHQSAAATGSANESLIYADSLGDLSWQNANLYLSKFITSANTANRSYTFPNANGTVALTSDISYPVTSVFGRTGAVVATNGDYTTTQVTEGTNLYYTDSRARLALSLTTTGTSGAATYNNTTGVFNIPNYAPDLSGYVTLATAQTISGTKTFTSFTKNDFGVLLNASGNYTAASGYNGFGGTSNGIRVVMGQTAIHDLVFSALANYTYTFPSATGTIALVGGSGVGTVTSVAALTIGTSGTDLSSSVANSTTTPVITLNVPTASATNRGALSSADWTTFNNKQSALTNPVTGTGTTNYLPKFTGTSTIGNSLVYDDGTNVGINTITPFAIAATNLSVNGASSAIQLGVAGVRNAQFYADGAEVRLYAVTNVPLRFGTNDTEGMRIFNDGNLLIQTGGTFTNNGYKLDVNGTGRFSGSLTVNGSYTYIQPNASTGLVGLYIQNNSTGGYGATLGLGLYGYSTSAYFNTLRIESSYPGFGRTLFWTKAQSNSTEVLALILDGTGAATFSSSVAIGTGATIANDITWTNNSGYGLLAQDGTRFVAYTTAGGLSLGYAAAKTIIQGNGGNVGIGCTPSAWTNITALEFAYGISIGSYTGAAIPNLYLTNNAYYNGTNWIYKASGYQPTLYAQASNGSYDWNIATGGTAGNIVTFNLAMRLFNSGNLVINSASDGGTHKLQVNGSIIATGFFESSDSKLKTLIQDNYQTKGIASITPKLYTKNGKVELGYYAQDLVGILDSAVSKGSDDMLSLSYREVHTAKIYALEQRIKELETK